MKRSKEYILHSDLIKFLELFIFITIHILNRYFKSKNKSRIALAKQLIQFYFAKSKYFSIYYKIRNLRKIAKQNRL